MASKVFAHVARAKPGLTSKFLLLETGVCPCFAPSPNPLGRGIHAQLFTTLCLAAALGCLPAFAQVLVDPARLPASVRNLDKLPDEKRLGCQVRAIAPAMTFGFRYQAGFVAQIPLALYPGKGHTWVMMTKVTPQGGSGKPVFLMNAARLPVIPPKSNLMGQIGGAYSLGPGKYRVQWMMVDEQNRACRKSWKISVKPKSSERLVSLALPEYTVDDMWLRRKSETQTAKVDKKPFDLTVMLHVAPMSMRRQRIGGYDKGTLIAALSSTIDVMQARKVRVIAFNLEQQKVIFRQESLTSNGRDQLAQAIDGLELGTVNYKVLQRPLGHLELLAKLIGDENGAAKPSDAVVFIGPQARYFDRLSAAALEKAPGLPPKFFYFQFRPFFRRESEANPDDSISSAVSKLKGKSVAIYSPGDFAKALLQLETSLKPTKP